MEASDTSLMGAELVAWLVEELGQPLIEHWRPYGRAIFVERRSRHVVVTSRTLTRNAMATSSVPKARRRPSVIPGRANAGAALEHAARPECPTARDASA